jgi:hypothetical protein
MGREHNTLRQKWSAGTARLILSLQVEQAQRLHALMLLSLLPRIGDHVEESIMADRNNLAHAHVYTMIWLLYACVSMDL